MPLLKPSMPLGESSLFCFGLGYTATHLAQDFSCVTGTSTTGRQGTLQFTDTQSIQRALEKATHVLISIPPVDAQDIVWKSYLKMLQNLPHLKWVGYLSTTSVYGDHQGQWVTETSPCTPFLLRDVNRLHIEQQWLQTPLPVHIFRLAGIYGKGRSVFDRLRSPSLKRIDKPGHLFSRIHVEDICQVLKASMGNPTPGEIFNVADDLPVESRMTLEYGCDLLKRDYPPLVPLEQANLSQRHLEFYQYSKCISNDKIKEILKVTLTYPTYKEGILSLFKDAERSYKQGNDHAAPKTSSVPKKFFSP